MDGWHGKARSFGLSPLDLRRRQSCRSQTKSAAARAQALVSGMATSKRVITSCRKERVSMSVERDDQERPCLHCTMVELIDDFFAEYPAASGESDAIDADEVVTAIAKTVAELTCGQDITIRQQLIEQLMREIMDYDAEFRRDAGTGAIGSDARH